MRTKTKKSILFENKLNWIPKNQSLIKIEKKYTMRNTQNDGKEKVLTFLVSKILK